MTFAYPRYVIRLEEGGPEVVLEPSNISVRIKWDSGFMDIYPAGIFDIEDTRTCLTKFRKAVKLSATSDLTEGTNLLEIWYRAIEAEQDFQCRCRTVIVSAYKNICDTIENSTDMPQKNKDAKLKRLNKHQSVELKRLDARKKRVQKCVDILSEIEKKYK